MIYICVFGLDIKYGKRIKNLRKKIRGVRNKMLPIHVGEDANLGISFVGVPANKYFVSNTPKKKSPE